MIKMKKLKKISIWGFVIIGVALLIGILSWKIIGPDNIIEQISEEVIEQFTGLEVDLSRANLE